MRLSYALAVLLASLSVPALADVIKLRADTWCPFNCDPGAGDKGYVIEIAQLALNKKGHTIDYQTLPWARALADAGIAKIDGAIGASATDAKTAGLIVGKESLGVTRYCVYGKDDSTAKFSGPADIKNFKRLAIVQDYAYSDGLDAEIKANKDKTDAVGGEDPQKINIGKLTGGRVDGMLEEASVMAYVLKKLDIKGVKKIGCESSSEPLYIAVSPKNPKSAELLQLLDDGVKELRKNGKLKSILTRYGVSDWKK